MCEVLCRAIDNIHPNPIKDRQGSYKKGDPVYIGEDNHQWSDNELSDRFFIVKFPGIPKEDMQYLLEHEPGTIRDLYPKAMIGIRRLIPVMSKNAKGGIHRLKRYKIDPNTQEIVRKPAGY